MFCVDCSRSMNNPSDFEELAETDDEDGSSKDECPTDDGSDVDANNGSRESPIDVDGLDDGQRAGMTFGQMKGEITIVYGTEVLRLINEEHISQHGSFPDMLAIILSGGSLKKTLARHIVNYLKTLCTRQSKHYDAEARLLSPWATFGRLRQANGYQQARWATNRRLMQGFVKHQEALCDYLIYCASIRTADTSPWKWTPRDSIPEGSKVSRPERAVSIEDLCIPKVRYLLIFSRYQN